MKSCYSVNFLLIFKHQIGRITVVTQPSFPRNDMHIRQFLTSLFMSSYKVKWMEVWVVYGHVMGLSIMG